MSKYLVFSLLAFIFLLNISYGDNIYVKLVPNEVITNGSIIKFNITVENIPKVGDIKYSDGEEDGGCRGVQININYSPDYLKPYGFNWSSLCNKEGMLKSYDFKNGTFSLKIVFKNPIEEDFSIGEIMFVPIKEGETQLNISGSISSALGYAYNGINSYEEYQTLQWKKYPSTEFFGAKVIIKGIGSLTNISIQNLKEEDVSLGTTSPSTIVNRIYITPNVNGPEVIVKEINVTEYQPVVKIIVEKKVNSNNIETDILYLVFGVIVGVIFGFILTRFK
ncbi:hypothetical protein ACO3TA_07015 [Methanocaldococcus sp. 28A]